MRVRVCILLCLVLDGSNARSRETPCLVWQKPPHSHTRCPTQSLECIYRAGSRAGGSGSDQLEGGYLIFESPLHRKTPDAVPSLSGSTVWGMWRNWQTRVDRISACRYRWYGKVESPRAEGKRGSSASHYYACESVFHRLFQQYTV